MFCPEFNCVLKCDVFMSPTEREHPDSGSVVKGWGGNEKVDFPGTGERLDLDHPHSVLICEVVR